MSTSIRILLGTAAAALFALAASPAAAQIEAQGQVIIQPAPSQPPPGYGQQQQYDPNQGYYDPNQQYQQQPQYQQYPQQQYQPQPRVVQRTTSIPALWVPGVILLPVSWVATWAIGIEAYFGDPAWSGPGREPDPAYLGWNFVPLVGPWIALGSAQTAGQFATSILGGTFQVAGLTMLILGLALRQTVEVETYSLDNSDRPTEFSFGLTPALGGAEATFTLSHF